MLNYDFIVVELHPSDDKKGILKASSFEDKNFSECFLSKSFL